MSTPTTAGFAPAKVNLYLHVTGRRPDGYHLLDSLVVFAGVGDSLAAEPADALTLRIEGPLAPAVPAGPDNIILRAAQALRDAAGRPGLGARLVLRKVLPVAAGIGGGSADAAAALRLLQALWALDLPADRLHAIATLLGADVPVCLAGRPAAMSGIGECLRRAPNLPAGWLVLVNPGIPVPTGPVFAALDGFGPPPPPLPARIPTIGALAELLAERRNDLELPARARVPAIDGVLAALAGQRDCLLARMSGSGGTCFGLFAHAAAAARAAEEIARRAPDWWVAAAPYFATAPEDGHPPARAAEHD